MADDVNVQPEEPQPKPALLTPGEIANLREAAVGAKALKGTMEHVGEERSGQLSPSHTPGRTR